MVATTEIENMPTMNRDHYRAMSTTSLQARLSRANERVKRTSELVDALDDLFTIEELETVLAERQPAKELSHA
jgi:hypothetical protein